MENLADQYIDLLKKVLCDYHRMELGEFKPIDVSNLSWKTKVLLQADKLLNQKGYAICRKIEFRKEDRLNGLDWPAYADTMIGIKRLDNLEYCVREVVKNGVEGDLIETGVWRGGATIFMKALLNVLRDTTRVVWVADSFEGLPKPNKELYPDDAFDEHYKIDELAISQETVENNFKKYGLLDNRVKFLKGWFKDTLPSAPISKLAVLRLDGDMYESTMDCLVHLYPKVSSGGYVIIDDYEAVKGCKKAVNDYRNKYGIEEELITIDKSAVYWQKK
jgi:O-methyltransferase